MKENILFYIGILKDLAPLIISLVAIWLTSRYQKHTKKLANDKMMKELFTEFNERYDKINGRLSIISNLSIEQWDKFPEIQKTTYTDTIIDFFNICSEEYYWYKSERLDEKIWNAWHKGMNSIYNESKVIQTIWSEECENEGYKSYYLTTKNELFIKK